MGSDDNLDDFSSSSSDDVESVREEERRRQKKRKKDHKKKKKKKDKKKKKSKKKRKHRREDYSLTDDSDSEDSRRQKRDRKRRRKESKNHKERRESDSDNEAAASTPQQIPAVAQALHWFDFDAFFKEVKRVCKPTGVLAVWCYELHQITPAVDAVIQKYYRDVVGSYWPEERRHIESAYCTIDFPFRSWLWSSDKRADPRSKH